MVEIVVFQRQGRICWNTTVTLKLLRHFAATFAQPGVGRRILMAGVIPISGPIFPWVKWVKWDGHGNYLGPNFCQILASELTCLDWEDLWLLDSEHLQHMQRIGWERLARCGSFGNSRIGGTRLHNTFETCCLFQTAMTSKLCKQTYSIGCGDCYPKNFCVASKDANMVKLCPSRILRKLRFDVIWGLKKDEQVIEGEEKDVEQDCLSSARHPENPPECALSGGTGATTKPLDILFLFVPLIKCSVIQLWRRTCSGYTWIYDQYIYQYDIFCIM